MSVHPDLIELRELLMREQDVKAVHGLQPLPDGRALYLIETPFMTFPKYAVGTTNEANDDVRIISTCSALWGAEEAFNEALPAEVRTLTLSELALELGRLKGDEPAVWAVICLHWSTALPEVQGRAAEVTWLEQGVSTGDVFLVPPMSRRLWLLPRDLVALLPSLCSRGCVSLWGDEFSPDEVYDRANAWLRARGVPSLFNLRCLVVERETTGKEPSAQSGTDAPAAALDLVPTAPTDQPPGGAEASSLPLSGECPAHERATRPGDGVPAPEVGGRLRDSSDHAKRKREGRQMKDGVLDDLLCRVPGVKVHRGLVIHSEEEVLDACLDAELSSGAAEEAEMIPELDDDVKALMGTADAQQGGVL